MADLITHLIFPLLILLVLCNKDKYIYIYTLVFFAIFPDLDIFYEHRALLHNIFIPIVLLIITFLVSWKIRTVLLIIIIYIFSHIILDIFNGGVKIFYPIYSQMFGIRPDIVMTESYKISYLFEFGFRDGYILSNPGTYIVSTGGVGIVVLVLILFVAKRYLYRKVYYE